VVKVTSAYANKMLKQYMEDKEYWVNKESTSCLYTAAMNEKPVVPEYDYSEVAGKIAELDDKIRMVKHAINVSNVSAVIDVADGKMAVDEILVRMAQLNKRKSTLDFLRKQQPQSRREARYYGRGLTQPEYQYINYDLNLVKREFERVAAEILSLQMALDKYNQTFEFEVEI